MPSEPNLESRIGEAVLTERASTYRMGVGTSKVQRAMHQYKGRIPPTLTLSYGASAEMCQVTESIYTKRLSSIRLSVYLKGAMRGGNAYDYVR